MNCNGHISITEDAFRLLFSRCGADRNSPSCDSRFAESNLNRYAGQYNGPDYKGRLCVAFAAESLYAAQMVAATDINLAGHYMDSLQHFHFMRAYSESAIQAHEKATEFIRNHTTSFVHETTAELRKMPIAKPNDPLIFTDQFGIPRSLTTVIPAGMGRPVIYKHPFSRNPFFNPSRLARALHCLQDSFSPAHVVRGKDRRINEIQVYSEQDGHDHYDHDEFSGMNPISTERTNAVEASADLLDLALRASLRMEISLTGWGAFAEKWLKPGNLRAVTEPPKKKTPGMSDAARGILFYTP
jgi:hypothetical protein